MSPRLSVMRFPSPDDPADAPVWENYVIAQAAFASLGAIAPDVLALGVEVAGTEVRLIVQRRNDVVPDEDVLDVWNISSDLSDLLGPDVSVSVVTTLRASSQLSPEDGVCWFYASRISPTGY